MIELDLLKWLLTATFIILSSLAGLSVACQFKWTSEAQMSNVPIALGFGLAPFIAGLAGIMALGIFRGASHETHTVVVLGILIILCFPAIISFNKLMSLVKQIKFPQLAVTEWLLLSTFLILALKLIFVSIFKPIIGNDSLEYALVGRLLFETRDLLSYPAIDATVGSSGFFGPWTHPPLYVALIYFSYILQGHASSNDLMPLISPWFALTGSVLIYSLGCMVNRTTGLAAACIFLATPLFFVGSSTAGIDPIPTAAMILVLASVLCITGSPIHRGLVIGCMLGVALWSHSQAILLIPLTLVAVFFKNRLTKTDSLMKQAAIIIGIASMIAAWPYWRNLQVFGSLISDNNVIFALPNLHWEELFSLSRGYMTWWDKIQYGLFKGWFSTSSFAATFWLMTLGIVLYYRRFFGVWFRRPALQRSNQILPDGWGNPMLAVLVVYLGGTLFSMIIGLDLMYKNDRYLLLCLPIAALFGGFAIDFVIDWLLSIFRVGNSVKIRFSAHKLVAVVRVGLYKKNILALFIGLILMLLGSKVAVFAYDSLRQLSKFEYMQYNKEERLSNWVGFRAVNFMRSALPEDAIIFSLKPSDMFFTNQKMISYLDTRLIAFYKETDPDKAYANLQQLGIRYIYSPGYSLPVVYNSQLKEILARPEMTKLLFDYAGYQVYELHRNKKHELGKSRNISPGQIPWKRIDSQRMMVSPAGLLRNVSLHTSIIKPDMPTQHFDLPVFSMLSWTSVFSGDGNSPYEFPLNGRIVVEESQEYSVKVIASGESWIRVYMSEFKENGETNALSQIYQVNEFPLVGSKPKYQFSKRIITSARTKYIRFFVNYTGHTSLKYLEVYLTKINSNSPDNI